MIFAGDTYLYANQAIDDHLWIILSDPALDPARVVVVNVTSHSDRKDQTCILDLWNHPWIKKKSCIAYNFARLCSRATIESLIKNEELIIKDQLAPEILQKVREGALRSPKMGLNMAQIISDQMGI